MDDQSQSPPVDIYKSIPLSEIPWNNEQPPDLLVGLIDAGKVTPCRAIDLGCGAGNYAVYLAGRGFDITGVDMSPTAIKFAKQNAKKKGVKCKFVVGDVIKYLSQAGQTYDFAYDWGLLHHIFPENRQKYVQGVHHALKNGGKYLSVCFNEKDMAFEGADKYRKTNLGSTVYLSSEIELRRLFEPLFDIIYFRVLEIKGKIMTHIFNYCFMSRK
jgi:SAM-dependent methyltransferase